MRRKVLTVPQRAILDYIKIRSRSGCPPTYKEIQDLMGYKSVNAAREHVNSLIRKGYVERLKSSEGKNIARGLKLL